MAFVYDATRARYLAHLDDPGLVQLPAVTQIMQTLERRVARPGEDVQPSLLMAPPACACRPVRAATTARRAQCPAVRRPTSP